MKQKYVFFWNSLGFSMIQQIPLPFLSPACIFGKSQFTYCLKPNLKNFEHNLISRWNECSCMVVWTFFGIAFLWDWNENWPFSGIWPLLGFPNLLIKCSTFTASSFRIWNSSSGILSPPLALFIVMLPKAHLTSHSTMSGSRWGNHTIMIIWFMTIFFV